MANNLEIFSTPHAKSKKCFIKMKEKSGKRTGNYNMYCIVKVINDDV